MAKLAPAKAAEPTYGVLFTNHKPGSCIITLSARELLTHECKPASHVPTLLQQEHTPLFEEVGIDFSVTCRNATCPYQV